MKEIEEVDSCLAPWSDHTPCSHCAPPFLQVNKKLASGILEDPENPSPSPEPIYDSNVSLPAQQPPGCRPFRKTARRKSVSPRDSPETSTLLATDPAPCLALQGKRTNTRDIRIKEKLIARRQELIEVGVAARGVGWLCRHSNHCVGVPLPFPSNASAPTRCSADSRGGR
jgi:hypothetical protein